MSGFTCPISTPLTDGEWEIMKLKAKYDRMKHEVTENIKTGLNILQVAIY